MFWSCEGNFNDNCNVPRIICNNFFMFYPRTWCCPSRSLFLKIIRNVLQAILDLLRMTCTAWKVSKYGVFSGPYFPVFGLNTEIYSVWGSKKDKMIEILQLRDKFQTVMVQCSRFIWITNSSNHRRVWTENLLHTK